MVRRDKAFWIRDVEEEEEEEEDWGCKTDEEAPKLLEFWLRRW